MSIGTALGLTGVAAGLATAGTIGGGLSAAGGIASSLIGSNAASTAAGEQQQSTDEAIAEQQREFNQTQANEQPWLQAGQGALAQLVSGTQPGGSLVTPFGETYDTPAPFSYAQFQAPTTLDETNDPGYQARLALGLQAVQRGQAASGGAFSGGTLQALTRYGQDYASNEYQNVYNRALQGYQTNFGDQLNSYNTNVSNALNAYNTRYNVYQGNQGSAFNRLAALAGLGQTATGQLAGAQQANAGNVTNLITEGGNAAAAGTLGSASAINTGIQGILNSYTSGNLINLLSGRTPAGVGSGEAPQYTGFYSGGDYQLGDD